MQSKPLNFSSAVLDHKAMSHVVFLDDHMKLQSIFRAVLLPGIISGTFDFSGGLCDDVNV